MPTTKPRMAITLAPETKAVLDELAEVSGQPASSFVAELLNEGAEAIFRPMIEALRLAKEKKVEAYDVLNHALAKTANNVSQLSLAIHEEKAQTRGRIKRAKE